MAAGAFDPTFGNAGVARVQYPTFLNYFVVDSLLQSGKVVALLQDSNGANALARFNTDGTPDATFGTNNDGLQTAGFGSDKASAIALQSNGSIVVALDNTTNIILRRFLLNGTPDGGFGAAGISQFPTGSTNAQSRDILVRPDDRIVVGATVDAGSGGDVDFALFGVTPNGQSDTQFGGANANVKTDFGVNDFLEHIALLNDGRIVATGAGSGLEVALYQADGSPATGFNGNGRNVFGTQPPKDAGLAVQSDGKIVAFTNAINNGSQLGLLRIDDKGGLDSTFGSGGAATTDASILTGSGDVIVDDAGNILVTYNDVDGQGVSHGAVIARFRSNGAVDTAFADGGSTAVVQDGATVSRLLETTGPKVIMVGVSPTPTATTNVLLAQLDNAASTPATTLTDLVFTQTSFAAGNYAAGDSIPATVTASAIGTVPSGIDFQAFLSTDNVAGNSDDVPLSETSRSFVAPSIVDGSTNLAPFITAPSTTLGQIPGNMPAGNYFVVIQLDPQNAVPETNKTNNTFVSKTAAITVATPLPPAPTLTSGGVNPAFGNAGVVRQQIGFQQTAGILQQTDGKIVVAGFGGGPTSTNSDVGVARFNADGTPDLTFGSGTSGAVFFDVRMTGLSADDFVTDFKLQTDGKIVVVGTANENSTSGAVIGSDFFVARLTTSGQLDSTFNATGIAVTDFSSDAANHPSSDIARNVLVMKDGRIVVVGRSNAGGAGTDFAVVRYNTDGTLDGNFNGGGKTLIDFAGLNDGAQAAEEAAFGSIVIAGYTGQGSSRNFGVVQLTSLGTLDPKFGAGGRFVFTAGGTDERLNWVDIDAKGSIAVAGSSGTGSTAAGNFTSDFITARLTSKGKLDSKYGVAGIARASFGQPANASYVQFTSDGGVIASGVTSTGVAQGTTGRFDIAIAEFAPNGTPDPTFSGDGKVILSTADSSSAAPGLQVANPFVLHPFAGGAAADALDAFQNAAEGKLADRQGGGALIAGTNGDQTVIAAVVTSGVELSGSLVAKLPISIIGGAKGSATISVTDLGDLAASGLIDIDLYTSTDQTLGSGDRKFFSLSNQKLSLKPLADKGKPKAFKAKFAFPTDLLDGTYFLLADVNSKRTITELNPNNNTAFTVQSTQIAAPFVDLTGPSLTGGNVLLQGKTVSLPLVLQNLGNTTLSGTAVFNFTLSLDTTLDSTDTSLAPSSVKVSLKANQTKPTKVKLVVPAIAPGNYSLFVNIDPGNTLQERTIANNLLVSVVPAIVS